MSLICDACIHNKSDHMCRGGSKEFLKGSESKSGVNIEGGVDPSIVSLK